MSQIQHQTRQKDGVLGYPPPLSSFSSPYGTIQKESATSSLPGPRITSVFLFMIVILAATFFISGLLRLLIRFLTKKHPSSSSESDGLPEASDSSAIQRQLGQLFHLHDSGLDQAFIEALPVFMYKEILGVKEPFDCAVCLSEFSGEDMLRLLPVCSHAFHINCIDTWLLSNSTCPLCRGALFTPDFSTHNPIFDFDDPREGDGFPSCGDCRFPLSEKMIDIEEIVSMQPEVVPVRLGKFKKLNDVEGHTTGEETSSSNLDARRCYSMGSYQYVVGDTNLIVALSLDDDVNCVRGLEQNYSLSVDSDVERKKISIGSKTDSYSVSKIWLWSKKGKFASSSDNPINSHSFNVDLPWMGKT